MKLKDIKIEESTDRVLEGEVVEPEPLHPIFADEDDDFFEALILLNDVSIVLAKLLDEDSYSMPEVTEESLKAIRDDIKDFHRTLR